MNDKKQSKRDVSISNAEKRERIKLYRNYAIVIGIITIFFGSLMAMESNNNTAEVVPMTEEGKEGLAIRLTDSGVKLYGLSTCSHCTNQKELFGEAVRYLDITECDVDTDEVCDELMAVPAWVLPNDRIIVGETSLANLEMLVTCVEEGDCQLGEAVVFKETNTTTNIEIQIGINMSDAVNTTNNATT